VETLVREWVRTGDDKAFAMKTRYFPSGVKPEGFTGTWTP